MSTHRSRFSYRANRFVGLVTVVLSFVAAAAGEVAAPPGGWTLRPGCGDECELLYVTGEAYDYQPSVVASPIGTTYSVHHRVGADLDGNGPQPITCFFIPTLPGAPDDVVEFDGIPEAIRTDLFGTIPTVDESDTALPDGRRAITILTRSPTGTDLFPSGFTQGGHPLTDACFAIGLVDAMTWVGLDTIISATIEFLKDDVVIVGEFNNAISFFSDPWNGVVEITLPNGAGDGFNGVRLSLVTSKSVVVANDGCRNQIQVTNGDTVFSTIGATTDGPDEPTACLFLSYSDIGSDIWYRYTATCDGNLTVDLCDSNYDTKVAVYDSPTCSVINDCPVASPPLDCNDDFCGLKSYVTIPVVIGHCYTIRIGGYLGVQGTGTMTLSCSVIPPPNGACCDDGDCLDTKSEVDCLNQNGTWFEDESCPSFQCPVSPPPNDVCAECIRVETGVAFHGRTRAATGTDISSCATNDTLDAWNCWTADCTGRVSITTCGSDFDTTLAVYTACGGTQLKCDDDSCPTGPFPLRRSKVTLDVTEGTTYTIRVSGHSGASGNYTLTVEDCKNACCLDEVCGLATASVCEAVGGTTVGPGSFCGVCSNGLNNSGECFDALDCPSGWVCDKDLDDNGIHDSCEPCPRKTILGAVPTSGTVDARAPYSATALLPRQGIGSPGETGSPRESIVIVLRPIDPSVDEPVAEGCFKLCETEVDPLLGANSVSAVTYHGAQVYELVLNHAITAGGVTTIEYLGARVDLGDVKFIEYIADPANVDGAAFIDATDVGEHVDCCLSELCAPWEIYSCDINRSDIVTPADTLAAIDLMNGTLLWDPWFGELLPDRGNTCPAP